MHIDRYSSSWSHTASPKARKKFVAFLSQIPPRGPFLPVVPVYNYCTVNNMRFVAFLDTEEVAGSNPVVPTISHVTSTTYKCDFSFSSPDGAEWCWDSSPLLPAGRSISTTFAFASRFWEEVAWVYRSTVIFALACRRSS
jgi:hypothetical protein